MFSCMIFAIIFLYIIPAHGNFTQNEIDFIDGAVQAVMKCKNIPGMGISLVRNGAVLNKGYGKARLDPPVAFDEFTVSNIGSTTKAFTAALIGVLITESEQKNESLGWTSKVADLLGSNFQMSSNFVTSEMTIKDLLIHRTGAKNQDFPIVTLLANITRERYARRLKHLPLTTSFRDGWSYNNFMYMIAGHVAEVIGGKKYEELVKEKLFTPLGMNASIFLSDASSRDEHFAYPYFEFNGTLSFQEKDFLLYRLGEFSPTGGIWSSAKDLSKWMTFLLGNGTTKNGYALIKKNVFDEMFKPHISLPSGVIDVFSLIKPFPVVSSTSWYGYAWFGRNYRGYKTLFHTGSYHAYTTVTSLHPQAKSGFFMFVNGPWPISYNTDLEPLSYFIADILLQEELWLNVSTVCTFPEPWKERPAPRNNTDEKLPADDYDVSRYLGHYGHRLNGEVMINEGSPYSRMSFQLNSVGEGNLTLISLNTSTFRMDFTGGLALVFGSSCTAQFDDVSNYRFQKLQLNCFGSFDYQRGVSFLTDEIPSPSAVEIPVYSVSAILACLLLSSAFM